MYNDLNQKRLSQPLTEHKLTTTTTTTAALFLYDASFIPYCFFVLFLLFTTILPYTLTLFHELFGTQAITSKI